jgi:hypothetical protein
LTNPKAPVDLSGKGNVPMFRSILAPLLLALVVAGLFLSSTQASVQETKDLFAPVFINRPSELYFSHCDTARYTFQAVSSATGLPSIWVRYRLVSGPGMIDSITGEWKLGPIFNHDSLGTFELEVGASELGLETEGLQNCHVMIAIADYLPLPHPATRDWQVSVGSVGQMEFRYSQVLQCGVAHTFLAGVTPNFSGAISYEDFGGQSTLTCQPGYADAGTSFNVRIGLTDDLDTTYLGFSLLVPSPPTQPELAIKISSRANELPGLFVEVPVTLDSPQTSNSLGGFDFLIAYDNTALALQTVSADSSGLYRDCKWEYFAFRYGSYGDCNGGCPSGLVKVVGLAETNNGDIHPLCGPSLRPPSATEIFRMRFLTSNRRELACTWSPIKFFWLDCSDNSLSNAGGFKLFLEQEVWDLDSIGAVPRLIDPGLATFPGYAGIPPEVCGEFSVPPSGKLAPRRNVAFYNGGIEFVCAESIDARGDINLNGIQYEIADYIMLEQFFLAGASVFDPHATGSLMASDVNRDGVQADLSDLVYLWRVMVGDAMPNPPVSSGSPKDTISVSYSNDAVNIQTQTDLAALKFVFRGAVQPSPRFASHPVTYVPSGDSTIVLVTPLPDYSSQPSFGSGPIMDIESDSGATLISASAATRQGSRVAVIIDSPTDANNHSSALPTHFALHQNYPNPFNGETVITFDLPKGAEVSLDVLNILGQVVWNSTGRYGAGSHQIRWNGTGDGGRMVSSGVYYYRLKAGGYVETKKMILLK